MNESMRQTKYDEFWKWINPTLRGYSAALDMLLRTLTDNQLDELLIEITETKEEKEENNG